jgi:hypothetical protein
MLSTPSFQNAGNTSPPWDGFFLETGEGGARGKTRCSGRSFPLEKGESSCSGEDVRGVWDKPDTSKLLSRSSLGQSTGDALERESPNYSRKRKQMDSRPDPTFSTALQIRKTVEKGEISDAEDTEETLCPSSPYLPGLESICSSPDNQSTLSSTEAEASTDIERNINNKQTEENVLDHIPPYDATYYLYLMCVSGEEGHTAEKTLTHIGKSRQPFRCVDLHNKRLLPSKLTQSAAGSWELEMVIGPVGNRYQAMQLKRLWSSATRGPVTRRAFGKWLASELGVSCYDTSFGNEERYRDAWTASRIERRRARRASKAASRNPSRLRRAKTTLFC